MMLFPMIILIIFIFVYLNSSNNNNRNYLGSTQSNNALEILDKRFANGEISEQEYLKRRSVLKHY